MTLVVTKFIPCLLPYVYWIGILLAAITFTLQYRNHRKWPKLASKMDEWPDESFLVEVTSEQEVKKKDDN